MALLDVIRLIRGNTEAVNDCHAHTLMAETHGGWVKLSCGFEPLWCGPLDSRQPAANTDNKSKGNWHSATA